MNKFYATIEFLTGQSAAILTLTNETGEWAGSTRIQTRSGLRSDLYEEAYRQASFNAHAKGGRLERFSVAKPAMGHAEYSATCGARIDPPFQHRRANALNVEPIQPFPRCVDKRPSHWPHNMTGLRWIASGGEAWVFGMCSSNCPRRAVA